MSAGKRRKQPVRRCQAIVVTEGYRDCRRMAIAEFMYQGIPGPKGLATYLHVWLCDEHAGGG